ncbi:MAG TPA: hypothetical protein VFH80_10240 [Solirubrobacteraceae bacterium]|nr:hypothetical protein [Solirubrobacteraceae bacterium]
MAGLLTAGQDRAEQLEALLYAALNPAVSTLTVVSGTAQQDASGLPSDVYVEVTGGASGTVTVAIGPDNTTADTIVPSSDATLSRTTHFRLPAGYWFKVTVGGSASIASAKQVVGG